MNRHRVLRIVLACCGLLLCVAALLWAGLRFAYLLPGLNPREVEFHDGRFALKLPANWIVAPSVYPDQELIIGHRTLPIAGQLAFRNGLTTQDFKLHDYLRSEGVSKLETLGEQRMGGTVAAMPAPQGGVLDVTHHIAQVDASGRLLHLRLKMEAPAGSEVLPSVLSDADFMSASVRHAGLRGDADIAEKEYDQWSPARAALKAIEADFELSFDALLWALLVFVLVWVLAHWVFERRLKLGKIGYTWVSQATTMVSFLGLLLAAASLFVNRMEHRAKLAESVTGQVASAAAFYMAEQAQLCPPKVRVNMRVDPLISDSKMVQIDCAAFSPVMQQLSQEFVFIGTQVLKQGKFADPRWHLGMPITRFIGRADRIISSAGFSGDEHSALSKRYFFYMDPLERALRVVQKQSDVLDVANAFRSLSGLWSVCLAASLALGMVKLSGDRRIEREKLAAEALKATNAEKAEKVEKAAKAAKSEGEPVAAPPNVAAVPEPAAPGQSPENLASPTDAAMAVQGERNGITEPAKQADDPRA